ncbi:MAG: hypothetical protein K6G75_09620 [Lachnospiraceae bacterium]|nr:hypothetical protein [Lachnospiraceae bacterium]
MKRRFITIFAVVSFSFLFACSNGNEVKQERNTSVSVNETVPEAEEEIAETDTDKPILDAVPTESKLGSGDSYLDAFKAGIVLDNMMTINIGDDFTSTAEKIGEYEAEEGQACLDDGYDTNYYYGDEDLIVYTYAGNGKQIVYGIYASKPGYKTSDKIEIGTTVKDDIYELYGDANESFGTTWVYYVTDKDTKLSIEFDKNDTVKSIYVNKDN